MTRRRWVLAVTWLVMLAYVLFSEWLLIRLFDAVLLGALTILFLTSPKPVRRVKVRRVRSQA